MKRLMVVDDEAVITTQLEDRLQSMKYDVVGIASSAEESVSMARELCPDLILMDIVMKGKLDGIEAAEIIKNEMDVPVIFLTGYTSDNYIQRAKKVMPFGYIVKPFREDDIRANIEIALYRKELERKQKQAEERIRRLFLAIEHSPYMVLIMDVEGRAEYVNSKFVQTTNYTLKEVAGKDILLLKSDETLPEIYEEMWDKITSGEEWRGELCIRRKDGTSCLRYTVAMPVEDTNGDIIFYVLVLEKVAKREKRREQLLQPEKMNSLRTVVAGIAHEFNNILAVVHGCAEVLEGGFENEKELKKGLHNIKKASDEGAEIVRNMITIAKADKDTSEYIFFDLKQLVIQAINSTIPGWKNAAYPGDIKYEIDRDGMKRIPGVFCNPTELREAFINIINNALDAMPDGGTITVATRCVRSKELGVGSRKVNDTEHLTQNSGLKGDFVEIAFADTGEGMSEEVKGKIFDPFFTTRRPQRTGLGMSIVYSIIARHGGRIEVDSELGKTTTITMSIPINNEVEQQKVSSKLTRDTMAKELRVLVVDDAEDMCDILDKFFSRAGHIVKTVGNGAEAIELTKKEDFDLVLCDLSMPDVTGYDVIKALNDLDKVPKIGVATGLGETFTSAEEDTLKIDFIIKKPFKLLELASKINALFDNG